MNEDQPKITRQLIQDYQHVFNRESDAVKRVICDLDNRFNNRIFPTGTPDSALCMAMELGKRDVLLYIIDKINANPDDLPQEVAEFSGSELLNEAALGGF